MLAHKQQGVCPSVAVFLSSGSAPAFPSHLLLLHQAAYWEGWGGQTRENKTEAGKVRKKKGRLKPKRLPTEVGYSTAFAAAKAPEG